MSLQPVARTSPSRGESPECQPGARPPHSPSWPSYFRASSHVPVHEQGAGMGPGMGVAWPPPSALAVISLLNSPARKESGGRSRRSPPQRETNTRPTLGSRRVSPTTRGHRQCSQCGCEPRAPAGGSPPHSGAGTGVTATQLSTWGRLHVSAFQWKLKNEARFVRIAKFLLQETATDLLLVACFLKE